MHVKEMPSRVLKAPVVKGVFLGWLRDLGGYTCFVVTHDHRAGGLTFRGHLMCAAGLDKPWKVVEGWENLTNGAANELITRHEKLAVWPEGSSE